MTEPKKCIIVVNTKSENTKPLCVIQRRAELHDVSVTTTYAITCKFCGSKHVVKYGTKGDIQYYLCHACNHTFAGNNALPGMRFPPAQIATALRLFYEGLSLDKIRREIDSLYHVYPSDSTVYEWVIRYTKAAIKEAKYSNIKVGRVWIVRTPVRRSRSSGRC